MGGGWRLVGAGGIRIGLVVLWHGHADEFAGARDVVGAGGSGEQTVVADTGEAFGQDVQEEAADELTGGQRPPLVLRSAGGAIILLAAGDAGLVARPHSAGCGLAPRGG